MRQLSPMGRAEPGDLSPPGKVRRGKGREEKTETHLKPASLLSPGFSASSAVLISSSQTHLLQDLGWGVLEGVGCRIAFP